ncbi:hypothetical protein FQA39_LY07229 [Lamprigera yunnana]|nr:hypothetical protein FQA39_LY07229 [Lamprigera yunnana]
MLKPHIYKPRAAAGTMLRVTSKFSCGEFNASFEREVVPIRSTSTSEDEEPSPLPSIINKLPVVLAEPSNLHAALGIQQQGSPVPETEQEKITVGAETTPPRRHSSNNIQIISPKPSTSAQLLN